EDEADTVYLLAKELAYDVVTGQTDNLAAALAKTSGKDFVQFAKVVGISHPTIDGKVCVTKKHSGSNFAKYTEKSYNDGRSKSEVAVCGATASHSTGGSITAQALKDFVKETLKEDGNGNWPTSREDTQNTHTRSETNDNANAVAKDLVNLNRDEKTIVAGLLAKTIEGGEVVEMC
ncbi:P44-new outer membrane protein, partial [Anaplasma phagocytophilum str. CRT38]